MTFVDRLFQLAYRLAYQLARVLWILIHPTTHGALIVVWCEGKLLVIRNSYVSYSSLPGGYLRGGETSLQAAIRELKEETNLEVCPTSLVLVHEETHEWESRRDHVMLYSVSIEEPVSVHIDHRELVSAAFVTPEEALKLRLFPPLRRYLEQYLLERAQLGTDPLASIPTAVQHHRVR